MWRSIEHCITTERMMTMLMELGLRHSIVCRRSSTRGAIFIFFLCHRPQVHGILSECTSRYSQYALSAHLPWYHDRNLKCYNVTPFVAQTEPWQHLVGSDEANDEKVSRLESRSTYDNMRKKMNCLKRYEIIKKFMLGLFS
jgi:hypothetical protein